MKDEAAIKSLYYDEMSAALAEATGASRVLPFYHWVRTGGDYAVDLHIDYSPARASRQFQESLGEDFKKNHPEKRYQILNAWRNIGDKSVENHSLALVGTSSVTSEAVTNNPFRAACLHASDTTRWCYYPAMGKDEVLQFKQYDSTWSDADAADFCYHSSFSEPEAAPGHTPRESIEVRFIVVNSTEKTSHASELRGERK